MAGEQLVSKRDELFVVCDERGDIDGAGGAGLYFRDMRHLSRLALALADQPLELLGSASDAIERLAVHLRAAAPRGGHGSSALEVTRERELGDALRETIVVENRARSATTVRLRLTLAADFRDMLDARGYAATAQGSPTIAAEGGGHRLAYADAAGNRYDTLVTVTPAPASATIDPGQPVTRELAALRAPRAGVDQPASETRQVPELTLGWELTVGPGASASVELLVTPSVTPAGGARELPRVASATLDDAATIASTNPAFDAIVARSLADLRALVTPLEGGGEIIAAGIPWYVAPFGRDGLITARQLLPFAPEVVARTLRYLAATQGTSDDPWRDEEPGKIVHEVRAGELSRRGLIPFSRYYGTADATALFLMLLADYLDWTADDALLDALRGNVDRALGWLDRRAAANPDGFVDFARNLDQGLVNQGWKDSDDSLQRVDGGEIPGPIALVEVQGYVVAAKEGIARHLARRGDADAAERLRREAAALRARIEQRFWLPDAGCYAQAVDGAGRPVDAITSNAAHLLACGVPEKGRALLTGEALLASDMFSGWGVRTLSERMPHYDPVSYHNGSVWPHDNGFVLWGLRRYQRLTEFDQLATALYACAARTPLGRLPELFCGHARDEDDPFALPVPYPTTCSPQAWAAGIPLVLIETLLGLRADAAARTLRLAPWLPGWLPAVELRGLRIGDARVDLRVRGARDDVAVELLANPDEIAVQLGG